MENQNSEMGGATATDMKAAQRRAFAELVMNKIERMGKFASSSYDAADFTLAVHSSEGSFRVKLTSLQHDCERAGPTNTDRILEHWLTAKLQVLTAEGIDFHKAKELLIPIIRSRSVVDGAEFKVVDPSCLRPLSDNLAFGGDAVVLLGLDVGSSIIRLEHKRNFERWGVSFEDCIMIAMDNLKRRSTAQFRKIADDVYQGNWNDGIESSRILLPNLLGKHPLLKNGVMMIPAENELLIAKANDADGLLHMLYIAGQMMARAKRPVSSRMYRYSGGVLTEFTPPFPKVMVAMQSLNTQWDQILHMNMKPPTLSPDIADGGHINLVGLELFEGKKTGKLQTSCIFPSGYPCALPIADYVFLTTLIPGAKAEPMCRATLVKWNDLHAQVGSDWQRLDCYPPRFMAKQFPTHDQVAALKKYDIDDL